MSKIITDCEGVSYPRMVLDGVTARKSGLGVYVNCTEALVMIALSIRTVTVPFKGRRAVEIAEVTQLMLSA